MASPAPTMRPGEQLASTVCSTRVVVVRAPGDTAVIACGGSPMVPAATAGKVAPSGEAATLIGKRYVDASGELEVLCTASGSGVLTCDGVELTLKTAKPLPASD